MYNFLLMDPALVESAKVYALTDIETVDDFKRRWEAERDDLQNLFGWHAPFVLDALMNPVVNAPRSKSKPGTWCGMVVVEVTYEQYVALCDNVLTS